MKWPRCGMQNLVVANREGFPVHLQGRESNPVRSRLWAWRWSRSSPPCCRWWGRVGTRPTLRRSTCGRTPVQALPCSATLLAFGRESSGSAWAAWTITCPDRGPQESNLRNLGLTSRPAPPDLEPSSPKGTGRPLSESALFNVRAPVTAARLMPCLVRASLSDATVTMGLLPYLPGRRQEKCSRTTQESVTPSSRRT